MSLNFYTVRLTGRCFLDLRALIFAEAFGYQTDFLIFPSLEILIPLTGFVDMDALDKFFRCLVDGRLTEHDEACRGRAVPVEIEAASVWQHANDHHVTQRLGSSTGDDFGCCGAQLFSLQSK